MSRAKPADLRVITAFCCVLIGVILGVALGESFEIRFRLSFGDGEPQMSYADLAAIMLATVTVLLALFAIGIGVFAFFGYRQLRLAAKDAALKKVEDEIKEGGVLWKLTQAGVDKMLNATASGEKPTEDKERWGDKQKEYGDE